jgi:hypothetical protein
MSLLDHLRRRAPWENPDPEVRAEAVRQLADDAQDLLAEIARNDAEARVRKTAVRRLATPEVLAEVARTDAEESVRDEAHAGLLHLAMAKGLLAEAAAEALTDTRHLATLARGAAEPAVRRAALARLHEPRALAAVAKSAVEPAIRMEALRRIQDASLLVDVAGRSEHKDVALAAVERIDDADALGFVAERGRNKAASRRARAKASPGTPEAPAGGAAAPDQEVPDGGAPAGALASAPEASAAEPAVEAEAPGEPAIAVAVAEASPVPPPEPAEAAVVDPPALDAATSEPAPPSAQVPAPPDAAPPEPQGAAGVHREEPATGERRQRIEHVAALALRLETLVKAEGLALRDADAALREARATLESLEGVPAKGRERLRAARAGLFARAQELRDADEWTRWGNALVQEELCARMEALLGREDLEKVAREFRECDARWAEYRLAPRDEAQSLRDRYQAARGQVRGRVDAYFAGKAKHEAENLRQKESFCERAEALADSTDWLKAAEELKSLQARWKEIGPVPHKRSDAVWKRFRAACDRFFTRRNEDLAKRKEEWSANLARKLALCERAEALAGSGDWEASAGELRRLQAEWKAIGPVRRKKSEEVWQRFRAACDAFFDRYKRRDALEAEGKRAAREALVGELEALLPAADEAREAPDDLAERVHSLLQRFRQGTPLAPADEAGLAARLLAARNRLIELHAERFKGTELDPSTSRSRKEKLCAKVEALASSIAPARPESLTGEDLARRLKEALATNTMGGAQDLEARRRAARQEVLAARTAWARLGPVPGEPGAALEERFRIACDRILPVRRAREAAASTH